VLVAQVSWEVPFTGLPGHCIHSDSSQSCGDLGSYKHPAICELAVERGLDTECSVPLPCGAPALLPAHPFSRKPRSHHSHYWCPTGFKMKSERRDACLPLPSGPDRQIVTWSTCCSNHKRLLVKHCLHSATCAAPSASLGGALGMLCSVRSVEFFDRILTPL
jgi:hypothetical protein